MGQTQMLHQEEEKAYPSQILTVAELSDRERDRRVLDLAQEYRKLSDEKVLFPPSDSTSIGDVAF